MTDQVDENVYAGAIPGWESGLAGSSTTATSISTSFDTLKQQLNTEISMREEATKLKIESLEKELDAYRRRAAPVELLLKERERLLEIIKLLGGKIDPGLNEDEMTSENAVPEQPMCMKRNCQYVRKMITRETRERSAYKIAWKRLKTQREADKEIINSWKAYHRKFMEKIRSAKPAFEHIVSLFTDVETHPDERLLADHQPATHSVQKSVSHNEYPLQMQNQLKSVGKSTSNHQETLDDCGHHASRSSVRDLLHSSASDSVNKSCDLRASSASRVVQSSQSTAAEDELPAENSNPLSNPEDPDSGPILISARYFKRKLSTGDTSKGIAVKDDLNSSPISSYRLAALFPKESVDLDERSPNVVTPRKRRKLVRSSLCQKEESSRSEGRATSLPLELSGSSRTAEVETSSALNNGNELCEPHPELRDKGELPTTLAMGKLQATGLSVPTANVKQEPSQQDKVLQPISVNRRISPSRAQIRTEFKRGSSGALENPAEDKSSVASDFPTPELYNRELSTMTTTTSNPHGRRLAELLETPLPQKQLGTSLSFSTANGFETTPVTSTKKSLQPHTHAKERKRHQDFIEVHTGKGQLRALPVEKLTLCDFKINPKSNDGYTYAYNEVVRNQQQRRCLPGCTRLECCGNQFRKMVELGGLRTSTRTLWDSSQDGKDDDQRLLEQHLGPNESWRLKTMSDEARREMLVQVKTHLLAQQLSRHRGHFPRARTPPGFWRTHMPSTQELEADRALSDKQTKDMVAERYWEALRPDGQWMFRDE